MNALAKITDFADVYAGGGAPQNADDFSENGIPFLRAGSLPKLLNGAKESDLEKITNEVAKKHKLQLHKKGSVVFAKSGMSATKGHIYRLKDDCYVVNHLAVIKPNANCDSNYLEHALKKYSPTTMILDAAYPSIRLSDISDFKIPLPPLAEQRRIAAILDKAAEIKAKREQAIAKLDVLAQSTFVEMFGDPVINDKGWNVAAIGDLPLFIADGNYSSKYPSASEFVESGVPFIRANNLKQLTVVDKDLRFITAKKHKELAKGHLKHRDVLVITRGEIGKVGLVPKIFEDANINAQLVLMRCLDNRLQPDYLCHLFNNKRFSKYVENFQTGAALKQLPVGNLKKVKIPLPSISVQESFSRFIQTLETQSATLQDYHFRTDNLLNSLQNQAFTTGFDA